MGRDGRERRHERTHAHARTSVADALVARLLLLLDVLLYALSAPLRYQPRMWHGAALAAVATLSIYELRLARECAPVVEALVENHSTVALSAQCDTRTPHHVPYVGLLDCATPRATLAKGVRMLTLECMLSKHPFAAYALLVRPVFFPERENAIEWLRGVAVAAALGGVAVWLVSTYVSYDRDRRLSSNFSTLIGALNRTTAAQAQAAHYRSERARDASRESDRARADARRLTYQPRATVEEIGA